MSFLTIRGLSAVPFLLTFRSLRRFFKPLKEASGVGRLRALSFEETTADFQFVQQPPGGLRIINAELLRVAIQISTLRF
jgi:hypothetical protein